MAASSCTLSEFMDFFPENWNMKSFLPGLLGLIFTGFPLVAQTPVPVKSPAEFWKSVYEGNHVVDIKIVVSRENWQTMFPQGGRGDYEYVKANLQIDGKPYNDSGIRFKGNSSFRFSGNSLKKPLKIDTNRFVSTQKLFGRTKFNLSNSFLDSAYMKEKLAYELFKKAGLATPGVGWANVTLTIEGVEDSVPLGLYVLIEQVDAKFLKRNLGEKSKDSLLMKPEVRSWQYLGDDPAAYSRFNIKSGETEVGLVKRFAELLKLIEQGSDEEFSAQIGQRLDLKLLAGYLAVTSLLVNLDSYVAAPHNYYLVLDKADGKLRLLPWDVNEAFGTFNLGNDPVQLTKWDIRKPYITNHKLLTRVFKLDSFNKLYRDTLSSLVNNEFTAAKIQARIAAFEKALLPHIETMGLQAVLGFHLGIDGDGQGINQAVERRVLAINPFVAQRLKSVQSQLAGQSRGQALRGGFF
ncbi:MAG: CotH kinase family protein [Planctomycetota bacterium]|nr:CotH kinase family protein [Planctomycetota bacterium]